MKKDIAYIVIGVLLIGGGYWWFKNKSQSDALSASDTSVTPTPVPTPAPTQAPTPAPITPPATTIMPTSTTTASTTAALVWTLRENGDPFIDTNMEVWVNNVQQLMQWSTGNGSLSLNQGDSVSVIACGGASKGNAWTVPSANTLIVTDNGDTVFNKSTSTDSASLSYSFIVQGGHAYNVLNYTLPSGQTSSATGKVDNAAIFYNKK